MEDLRRERSAGVVGVGGVASWVCVERRRTRRWRRVSSEGLRQRAAAEAMVGEARRGAGEAGGEREEGKSSGGA
jgi:hypothetical protein